MKHSVEATYEKGLLRPTRPLALREGQVLRLILDSEPDSDQPVAKAGFDFSDLAGKLHWTGDALRTQRSMRDEWD